MNISVDENLALTLRALGHPVRLEILRILAVHSGNGCCTDVTGCLALAQSTVSQHLKVLLDAGIIERQPAGTRNRYTVCRKRLESFSIGLSGYLGSLDLPGAPAPD